MSLEDAKVIVCVGTGGVGKTTVSAALAIASACRGQRTLVMTIDPARRLAQSLGLSDLGNIEHELTPDDLKPHGIDLKANLSVMAPDVKRTFDGLVERFASEKTREKLFQNRIYQHFSTMLAGSLEYAAVEKLHEVYRSGRYDVIVLDTPPAQNVVDFLQAPTRITDFLDNDALQWLLKPYAVAGRWSLKLLDFGGGLVLKSLGKLAGDSTMEDLAEFVLSFEGLHEGFRQRSHDVRNLLGSDEVAFVMVVSPTTSQLGTSRQVMHELQREGISPRMLVVNRVRPLVPGEWVTSVEKVDEDLGTALIEEKVLADRDAESVERFSAMFKELPLIRIAEQSRDVHDLNGLARLQGSLQKQMYGNR